MQSLRIQAIRAVQWNAAGIAANAVLQIAVLSVMARLVAPASFGVIAMGQLVLRFFSYFAGLGTGAAIVRKPDLTARDWRICLGLSAGSGCLLAVAAWGVASAVPLMPDAPDLCWVVRLLAVAFAVNGLAVPSQALLTRQLQFGKLAGIEVSAYALGYGLVGIPLAYVGWEVWALVAALLAQTGFSALGWVIFARGGYSLGGGVPGSVRSLFAYGAQYSIAGFLEFLGNASDQLLAGRFLGRHLLGLYSRSLLLINLPLQFMASAVSRVLFPVFGRLQGDRQALRRTYLMTVATMGLVTIPPALAAGPLARDVLRGFFGAGWVEGWPGFVAYALIAPMALLTGAALAVNDLVGSMRWKLWLQTLTLAWLLSAGWCGLTWGLPGLALAAVSGYTWRAILAFTKVHRMIDVKANAFVAALTPGLVVGGVCGLVSLGCIVFIPGSYPWVRMGVAAGVGVPVAIVVMLTVRMPHVREMAGLIAEAYPPLLAFPPTGSLLRQMKRPGDLKEWKEGGIL